jgi:hypothetical protein
MQEASPYACTRKLSSPIIVCLHVDFITRIMQFTPMCIRDISAHKTYKARRHLCYAIVCSLHLICYLNINKSKE